MSTICDNCLSPCFHRPLGSGLWQPQTRSCLLWKHGGECACAEPKAHRRLLGMCACPWKGPVAPDVQTESCLCSELLSSARAGLQDLPGLSWAWPALCSVTGRRASRPPLCGPGGACVDRRDRGSQVGWARFLGNRPGGTAPCWPLSRGPGQGLSAKG